MDHFGNCRKERKRNGSGNSSHSWRSGGSEKAERLRELTEKLKGFSSQSSRSCGRCGSPSDTSLSASLPMNVDNIGKSNEKQLNNSFRSVSLSQVDFSAKDSMSGGSNNRCLTHPLTKRGSRHNAKTVKAKTPLTNEEISTTVIPSVVAEINSLGTLEKRDAVTSESKQSHADKLSDITKIQLATIRKTPRVFRNSSMPCERNVDKLRKRKGVYITKWPTVMKQHNYNLSQDSLRANDKDCAKKSDVNIGDNWEQCWGAAQNGNNPDEYLGGWSDWNGLLVRVDSLSESESEPRDNGPCLTVYKSDVRPNDNHSSKRYSKRPLRGPYGEMLEAEMMKGDNNTIVSKLDYRKDLKFLNDLLVSKNREVVDKTYINNSDKTVKSSSQISLRPKQECTLNTCSKPPSRDRDLGNRSLDDTHIRSATEHRKSGLSQVRHQRTTSSPSKLEDIEPLKIPVFRDNLINDTRTHIVVELYDTERIYVESLQILVLKYLQPLKRPENIGLLEPAVVDDIFCQVPALLKHHEIFLEELRDRLEHWDIKQKIGDVFIEVFTKPSVIETYTAFVNNWKKAKELIKSTSQAKPAFAKFLETMARENKGKFALDSLLIKPIQKFPKYEMLIQRLLKHTDISHPDHQLLLEAQHQIHDLLLKMNCTERETNEFEQQQQNLKELECLVEGLINLVVSDRQYLRYDMVEMMTVQGTRKERALFLFSDLLVITSIKRRSGTIRKPSTVCPASIANTLETHKYKLLMRIPLDDLEIIKSKDGNVHRIMHEIENISEDVATLNQINELIWSLHCPHEQLEEVVRDMLVSINRQLAERQNSGIPVSFLELSLNTSNGVEVLSILFPKNEKRASWEDAFNEAKQKLAQTPDKRPAPEFLSSVPIRKTRSGLQFTCAAAALGTGDVWVCNSDGYVGQVCILSIQPKPTVVSCNSVCNARIVCMASVPTDFVRGSTNNQKYLRTNRKSSMNIKMQVNEQNIGNINIDSSSSSESDNETNKCMSRGGSLTNLSNIDSNEHVESTMWLGTEDGCIHLYNCCDNIRIKKNKIKIQHNSAVQCIMYFDNRVFVALANGDILIYRRENSVWNTTEPNIISIGTILMPVTHMLTHATKLWCGCPNTIKIINIHSLQIEHMFQLSNDNSKQLSCMTVSGLGIWLAMQNSAIIKCYHACNYELLCEVNITSAVNKMLSTGCDDIIRQHKAACLRVTALMACKDVLWMGTSAGVLLTLFLPHVVPNMDRITTQLNVTGLPHGHTGQVRFITYVDDKSYIANDLLKCNHHRYSIQSNRDDEKLLIISGGDGYEDFRNSSVSELAGREDSTNHLLLWQM